VAQLLGFGSETEQMQQGSTMSAFGDAKYSILYSTVVLLMRATTQRCTRGQCGWRRLDYIVYLYTQMAVLPLSLRVYANLHHLTNVHADVTTSIIFNYILFLPNQV